MSVIVSRHINNQVKFSIILRLLMTAGEGSLHLRVDTHMYEGHSKSS